MHRFVNELYGVFLRNNDAITFVLLAIYWGLTFENVRISVHDMYKHIDLQPTNIISGDFSFTATSFECDEKYNKIIIIIVIILDKI